MDLLAATNDTAARLGAAEGFPRATLFGELLVREGDVVVPAEFHVACTHFQTDSKLPELIVGLGIQHVGEYVCPDESALLEEARLVAIVMGESAERLGAKQVPVAEAHGGGDFATLAVGNVGLQK